MDYTEDINAFNSEREKEDGYKVLKVISKILSDVQSEFLTLNGGELAEHQIKLAGYKFYLSDYLCNISRKSEELKLLLKNIRADKWDEITEKIKLKDGKVKNKEQIENELVKVTTKIQLEQALYETLYYNYKIKISAMDNILTAIAQRIADLKRQVDTTR